MISVLMATYNENEEVLRKAIESILNQTVSDFEFIIVLDNPSNTMHKEVIQGYADIDPRIRFYQNETNLGLCASLNRLIEYSSGQYIARMDADDISFADRFERQLKYLETNHFDLIGGIPVMVNEKEEIIQSISSIPTKESAIQKCLRYSQCIAHPTWFGKRSLFIENEGYRNVPYCEDYDFTLRAVLNGARISNLNEQVLYYRMTKDSISRSNIYKQYLYMREITSAYSKGKVADLESLHQNVDRAYDVRQEIRFVRSNIIFNRMLKEKTDKKIVPFIIDGFRLLFGSYLFLNKIYRFVKLTINS